MNGTLRYTINCSYPSGTISINLEQSNGPDNVRYSKRTQGIYRRTNTTW